MRLTTLLLLLVAVLLLTAPAASFAQIAKSVQTADLFTPDSAAIIHPNGSAPSTSDLSPSQLKFDTMNSPSVCFTMRTYVVARNSPNSEATHPAGYYECLPSWKLEMRRSGRKDRGRDEEKDTERVP